MLPDPRHRIFVRSGADAGPVLPVRPSAVWLVG